MTDAQIIENIVLASRIKGILTQSVFSIATLHHPYLTANIFENLGSCFKLRPSQQINHWYLTSMEQLFDITFGRMSVGSRFLAPFSSAELALEG